eukprot:5552304-Alexandrium_andersonii.AAC.1
MPNTGTGAGGSTLLTRGRRSPGGTSLRHTPFLGLHLLAPRSSPGGAGGAPISRCATQLGRPPGLVAGLTIDSNVRAGRRVSPPRARGPDCDQGAARAA